jgi:hypothetical protein
LMEEALKLMTRTKLKLALGITAGILLAGGATTMLISETTGGNIPTSQEIARQSQAAYAALTAYSDSGTVEVQGIGDNPYKMFFNIRLARPNSYRIGWAREDAKLAKPVSDIMTGVVWSDGSGNFAEAGLSGKMKEEDMKSALALGAFISGNSAINIPGTFFKEAWGDALSLSAAGKVQTIKKPNELVGDVDCYVISREVRADTLRAEGKLPNLGNLGTATSVEVFWIGKHDHLIHQIQSSLDLSSISTPPLLSDVEATKMLEQAKEPVTPENIARLKMEYEKNAKPAFLSTLKSGKIVFTEIHENIEVNKKFSNADFVR